MSYQSIYNESLENPSAFWQKQAKAIAWYQFPSTILSKDEHHYDEWFTDGKLNMSYLCIDKHIEDGFGNHIAIIFDSPVSNCIL